MNCKRCQTNIIDDDIKNCPVCSSPLYGPVGGMKPDDYDPSEDADVPVEAYMRARDVVAEKAVVNPEKPKRRVIKHRKGWVDPRKRKAVA